MFAHGHALIIAPGNYATAQPLPADARRPRAVPHTVADAHAFAALLANLDICGYPAGQVTLLEPADESAVLAALDALAASLTPDATLLVWYAGHGMYDAAGAYYLTTSDTVLDAPDQVRPGSGIREDALLTRLRQIRAGRVIVLINACHAGDLGPDVLSSHDDTSTGAAPSDELARALLATGEGRALLSACRAGQRAYYRRSETLTLFGAALVAALRDAEPASRYATVSVNELYETLHATVTTRAQTELDATQEPVLTVIQQVGRIPVALRPGWRARGPDVLGDLDADPADAASTHVQQVDPATAAQALDAILARYAQPYTPPLVVPTPVPLAANTPNTKESPMAFSAHALVIGVSTYTHAPQLNVPITAADAKAVASELGNAETCGYPPEQVMLLPPEQATRAGILAALDTLARRAGPDDTVCLFYAGHGIHGDDGYYLTTADTQLAGKKVVVGTGVREAELITKLRAIKAKKVLLLINACHSGEVSPVLAGGEDAPPSGTPPPNVTAALLGTGTGRVIITACREQQYAYIGPGPETIFTRALLAGLRGAVVGQRGVISVFDLYSHLYYTIDELVGREIPAATRAKYGETQQPELTILKGVGPFPVALYRGSATLGAFDDRATPPDLPTVRQVNPAYSQHAVRQFTQQITNSTVGAAVAGDNHGTITVNQAGTTTQHGGVNFGSGNTVDNVRMGDIISGDKVGGDKFTGDKIMGDRIQTGDVSGTGIAIGSGARSNVRNVNTSGGDYVQGSQDTRKGTFVDGDQYNLSGNFSGAMVNIKSTLTNVSQRIGAAPHGDAAAKAELQRLVEQLRAALQQAQPAQAAEAEAVAETAKAAVEQATKPQPNKTMVQISAEGLKQAAQNLAGALPAVIPLATQIADAVRRFVGM